MFTHRWSFILGTASALLLFAIIMGSLLFSATHSQQRELSARATLQQQQLAAILGPSISHYNTDAIRRVTQAFLSGDITTISLTDHVTSEQASWLNESPLPAPQWYYSLIPIDDITLTSTIDSEGSPVADMTIIVSGYNARENVFAQLKDAILPLGIMTVLFALWFSRVFSHRQTAIDVATQTIHQVSQQDFASAQSSPSTGSAPLDSALKSLTTNIQRMIGALHKELKTLHNDMMYDAASGLPNRQYFSHQLTSWMSDNEDAPGAVFIAEMRWLDTIYRHYGYAARDETWRLLANSLNSAFESDSNICIARISETEVALLLPARSEEQCRLSLHNLISTLNNEVIMAGFEQNQGFHIGAVHGQGLPGSQLLSLADNALQRAIKQHDVFVFNRGSEEQVIDRETWRSLLADVMDKKSIRLQTQPIAPLDNDEDTPFHLEVFTQALVSDKWQAAGRLMPYIQLFEKGAAFDRMVIEHLASLHKSSPITQPLALNLTDESLSDRTFLRWLEQMLKTALPASLLSFEISEASARNNLSACVAFSEKVREYGASVGIDHFGRYLQSVEYLPTLKPAYVKLDHALSQEQTSQNRLFTETLANIADSLAIRVIATGIKDDDSKARLNRDVIDAYQGFIHPPELMLTNAIEQ